MTLKTEYNDQPERDENRCKGTTRAGRPCRAAATEGGLCFFHSNPNKAAELGRIGGTKNRYTFVDELRAPLAIESVKEVQTTLSRLIDEVYSSSVVSQDRRRTRCTVESTVANNSLDGSREKDRKTGAGAGSIARYVQLSADYYAAFERDRCR